MCPGGTPLKKPKPHNNDNDDDDDDNNDEDNDEEDLQLDLDDEGLKRKRAHTKPRGKKNQAPKAKKVSRKKTTKTTFTR